MAATEITHSLLPDDIQAVLPDGYEYKIREYQPHETGGWFTLNFSMKLTSSEEIKNWRKEHEDKTCCTWRVERTRPIEQRYVLFKEEYRCQRKTLTKNPKRRSKGTGCKARLILTLKRMAISRGRKSLHSEWPTVAILHWQHNHCLTTVDNISQRDVGTKAKETLMELFANGFSASVAHEKLREELMEEYGDLFPSVEKDRSVFPDISYCYRLHSSAFMKSFGTLAGEDLTDYFTNVVSEYSAAEHGGKASLIFGDELIIMAIMTPLMHRIHTLIQSSKDLVFFTSYTSAKHHWKVILLLTHSPVGGLPLGVLVTSSKDTTGVKAALDLWLTLLDENSFYGNQSPSVLVAEKPSEDADALREVFPNASHLTNAFGSLPLVWTWLLDARNNIPVADRRVLIQKMRSMMGASTDLELKEQFCLLKFCLVAQRYPEFLSLVDGVFAERSCWPVCSRSSTCIDGDKSTQIMNELTNSIFRDKVLHRVRSLPLPLLIDFLLQRLDAHYIKRTTDVGFSNIDGILTSRFASRVKNVQQMDIAKLGECHYCVVSSQQNLRSHEVLSDVGLCSCGRGADPCLHQAAVYSRYNLMPKDFPLPSPKLRSTLWQVALGDSEMSSDWFALIDDVKREDIKLEGVVADEESSTPVEVSCLEETQSILNDLWEKLQKPEHEASAREFIRSYRDIKSDSHLLHACANFGKFSMGEQNVTYVLMEES